MAPASVKCSECGQLLYEPSDLPSAERSGCPSCGSTGRAFAINPASTVEVASSLSWIKTGTFYEHHRGWQAAVLLLTIASAFVGFLLGAAAGAMVGLAFGLAAYYLGPRAVTTVRHVERGGTS